MKNMSAFRLTSFVCFYFALIALAPFFREWSWIPVLTTLLILLASLAAARCKHLAARLAISVIPLAAPALALYLNEILPAIASTLPVIAVAVLVVTARDEIELYRARREFIALSVVGLLICIISLNPLIMSVPTFIYLGAYLMFSILALRSGRVGRTGSSRWQAGNIGYFLLPIAASAGAGVVLMIGFDRLMAWLSQFFLDSGHELSNSTPNPERAESFIRAELTLPPNSSPRPTEMPTPKPDTYIRIMNHELDWRWLLAAVLFLVAAAVLIRLLLGSRKRNAAAGDALEMELENDESDRTSRRKKRRNADRNRERVRDLYRQYLNYLRMNGLRIRYSETTGEISDAAIQITKSDAVLREIYRKSRYRGFERITDEDVKQAEACFAELIASNKQPDAANGEKQPE